ncbi:uncharacterized protein [Lolium perenne]|uniref:uncharacterized protein isoform X2 n=1 Tax=Lolium perenne TaxID=4522 RepID=UPI0021F6592B|nr:uncharacterized protein LOC127333491 isoform X2 [Lolium perenne]
MSRAPCDSRRRSPSPAALDSANTAAFSQKPSLQQMEILNTRPARSGGSRRCRRNPWHLLKKISKKKSSEACEKLQQSSDVRDGIDILGPRRS